MNKALKHDLPSIITSKYLSIQDPFTNTHFVQKLQHSRHLYSVFSVHSSVVKSGYLDDPFTTNHLLNSYLRFRRIKYAHQVFDEMPHPNVVSWTSLMAGYIDSGEPETALRLFGTMCRTTVFPNSFTYSSAINACSFLADLETGQKIHARIERLGFQSSVVISTALIDMYGKSNDVVEARRVFDTMVYRNVVSWSSIIAVYSQNALGDEALRLFGEFIQIGSEPPNQFMFSSIISACASLGRLGAGKVAHGAVIRLSHNSNDIVAGALVDMYAKCGCIGYSDKVFGQIEEPSVIPYTSMIVGAAKHGLGKVSLELFEEMLERGIRPNTVTLIGVLYACSHSGLVDTGLEHLNSMQARHDIEPDAKHYTCVVDMLGRVGRVDEAHNLAKSTPAEAKDAALLWGSLLSASRIHGRLDIAVEAGQRLIELNQQLASVYVTMSNTFASVGKWEKVHGLRRAMKQQGVQKEPGCSWVEIKDRTYVFYAGDLSRCARVREVMRLLRELERMMKERGYVSRNKGLVFVDVEEEDKEAIVGLHSEKLALAFGLISIPKGMTIRVMKNLRMCFSCHEAFKLISEIVERDFVVRDLNRFHHFKDGSCTCGDFW